MLRKSHPELAVHWSAGRGDAEARVRAWAAAQRDGLVLVLGGDGTIHEVVNALEAAQSGAALAVLPAGSGNDFARNLGLPLGPDAALEWLQHRRVRRIDLGRVRFHAPTGAPWSRCFVNSLSLGASERANRIARRLRWLPGRLRYALAGALALLGRARRDLELSSGSTTLHRGPALNLTLANGAHFGAGLRISPASRPDDGVLDLVLIAPLPRLTALRVLASLRHGGHLALPEVRVQQVREAVRLSAGAASCGIEMDGEAYQAAGALRVELLPGRLAVRC